jgi:hypothetical protein
MIGLHEAGEYGLRCLRIGLGLELGLSAGSRPRRHRGSVLLDGGYDANILADLEVGLEAIGVRVMSE